MRRLLALALGLVCLSADASPRFPAQWWNKNPQSLIHKYSAALTADNCTGVDQAGITWTRATTALCTKNDGSSLLSVTSGQPRCNVSGCLVEPAATNLAPYSSDMANASGYTGNFTLPDAGVEGGTWASTVEVTDPLGGTSAGKLTWPSMEGAEGTLTTNFAEYSIAGLADGTYAVSVWARSDTGTRTYYLWINSGASKFPIVCTATATWSRCTGTITATNLGKVRVGFDLRTSTPQQMGQPAGTIYVWGAQLEAGALNTSTILTVAAAATRNADNVSFTPPVWLTDTQGCASATILTPNPTALARALSFDSGGSVFITSSTSMSVNDSTNTVSSTVTDITSRSVILTSTWTGSSLGLTADGVSSTGTYDGSLIGTTLRLGSTSGTSNFLRGYISAVKLGNTTTACQ